MRNKPLLSKVVLTTLVVASAILGVLRFNSFQEGAYTDDAHYIVLAESLANGQGYRLINFPNPPIEQNFPFGWSLLLSPIAALFPNNLTALKFLSFAFWLASIPLAYRLFTSRIGTPYLEMLVALIALNPMLGISGMLMSEVAYLFFSLLTLNILDYWNNHNQKNWLFIVVVAVALYTQLIRTVGISILLTVILYLLISRRFRQLGIAAIVIALGMVPQFWLYTQRGGSLISSGYQSNVFGSLSTKPAEMWWNVQSYFDEMISNSLVPIFGPNIASAFDKFGLGIIIPLMNGLILLMLALGIILTFRYFQFNDLYAILYFVGILTFWIPQFGRGQERFLVPLVPFLYFYLLQAIVWLAHHIPNLNDKRVPVVIVLGLTSLIVLFSFARNIQDWQNPIRNRMTDLSVGTTWIRENTPQASVIMARDPVPDYLYARRKTVAYPADGQDLEKAIASNGVAYIMVSPKLQTPRTYELDNFTKSNLLPMLISNQNRFRLVYSDTANNVSIYNVHSR